MSRVEKSLSRTSSERRKTDREKRVGLLCKDNPVPYFMFLSEETDHTVKYMKKVSQKILRFSKVIFLKVILTVLTCSSCWMHCWAWLPWSSKETSFTAKKKPSLQRKRWMSSFRLWRLKSIFIYQKGFSPIKRISPIKHIFSWHYNSNLLLL